VLADTRDLARTLAALEAELKGRLDMHEAAIVDVLQRIMQLLDPPPEPEPPRRQIGFHTRPHEQSTDVSRSKKSFAERRNEFKAEEKALEKAKSVRLPFKRPR
jgi:hypothetical protein